MKIIEQFSTKSPCYTANIKATNKRYLDFQRKGPQGFALHSVGCPQPKAQVFADKWNKSEPERDGVAHAVLEPNKVIQCLPWNFRGWHIGGVGNDTFIGVEMTEPATIKYTGGSTWVDLDPEKTKAHVLGTYKTAVELFAYLCKKFNKDPLADGVILSHSEAHKRGLASNHGDPEHMWRKYGLTMDGFRRDVKKLLSGASSVQTPAKTPAEPPKTPKTPKTPTNAYYPYKVKVTASLLNIRAGAGTNHPVTGKILDRGVYSIVDEQKGQGARLWGKLKSGAGWVALDNTTRI